MPKRGDVYHLVDVPGKDEPERRYDGALFSTKRDPKGESGRYVLSLDRWDPDSRKPDKAKRIEFESGAVLDLKQEGPLLVELKSYDDAPRQPKKGGRPKKPDDDFNLF